MKFKGTYQPPASRVIATPDARQWVGEFVGVMLWILK